MILKMTDSLVTGPQVPPMTVEYARRHIRALTYDDDVMIRTWIEAARSYFEEQTGRQIITATRELWLDAFPTTGRIELPHPPLQSVLSVLYINSDGTLTSYDDAACPPTVSYQVKAPQGEYCDRGWVEPLSGFSWPIPRTESGAVRIQYVCGYGDSPDSVPELITGILCYLVAQHDMFRVPVTEKGGVEVPLGVTQMMAGFKYSAYPTMVLRDAAVV